MNRQELLEAYIDRILDNMSTKDFLRIVGDQIEENLSSYTDEELISEVEEYYPELLEEWWEQRFAGFVLTLKGGSFKGLIPTMKQKEWLISIHEQGPLHPLWHTDQRG